MTEAEQERAKVVAYLRKQASSYDTLAQAARRDADGDMVRRHVTTCHALLNAAIEMENRKHLG